MKNFLKKMIRLFNLEVLNSNKFRQLLEIEANQNELLDFLSKQLCRKDLSNSQLRQDLFVLLATNFKEKGFFVEFGATDGVKLSNTYLLEKHYNWNGILAEPAKVWQKKLCENRGVRIDFDCVWKETGENLKFTMAKDAELSTLSNCIEVDNNINGSEGNIIYDVKTVSLNDLLLRHNAPYEIDYLSIDTEGSEFEILNSFDFRKHKISIITCEHNYNHNREKIHNLLKKEGYERKFLGFSKWDDWYFKL